MSHLNPGNFPKKRPLKLVEPSLLKRSIYRKQKRKDINSGIDFGDEGLDGRKCRRVSSGTSFHWNSWVNFWCFLFVCSFVFAFSPECVLRQVCLKDPFSQHKLDDKVALDL